jgi:hypothetical protein
MNFDSEPSAVSSGEDEGVTGSENEPAWKRYSLICLISISCAIVRYVRRLSGRFSALPAFEARGIQDSDGLFGGRKVTRVCGVEVR